MNNLNILCIFGLYNFLDNNINIMEEEKINLIDYIRVIIKRKKLILCFLLAGLAIGGSIVFLLPKTYKAEVYLKVGSEESPSNLAMKVNAGFFGSCPGIKATSLKTGFVKIEASSENPDKAKKNLENISKLILERENQKIKAKKKYLENSIEKLNKKIEFLLYRKNEVAPLELKVFNIQEQIDNIQPTKIVKEPVVVSKKEANLIFNLLSGGLLGIFLGMFLSFIKEWWEKNKKEL